MFKVSWLFAALLVVCSCNTNPRKAVSKSKIDVNESSKAITDNDKNDSVAMAQIETLPEYKPC